MISDERHGKGRPRQEDPVDGRAAGRAQMFGGLIAASHLTTMEQLPDLVAEHAARVGLEEVLIYLADLQQAMLFPLTGVGPDAGREPGGRPGDLRVEGTVPGRAFQHGEILPASHARAGRWWVPLLDGVERLGLLQVTAPAADAQTMQDMENLASLVALMVVSKRGLSDSYARLVRRRPMNVAAEMEWRLMPPRTFATDRVLISAVMEPAYEVSGDAFDHALSADTVHLSVFDAMGHDTAAGLTANLAVAAYRSYRHQGAGLLRTAEAIEQVLLEQFGGRRYVTGILTSLDVTTGVLSWVSRGHHPPVVIRGGRSAVGLKCPAAPPMGTGLGIPATLCRDQLQPGDRLLLYTDGITEARNPGGQEFGLDRFTDFLIRHHADGLPVPETLRRLIRHHLDYHHGRLNDDATVLLLEWHGPAPFAPGQAESLVGLPEATTPAGPRHRPGADLGSGRTAPPPNDSGCQRP